MRLTQGCYFTGEMDMPRKQRFKPTRKPKLTVEGSFEHEDQQPRPASEESVLSQRAEDHEQERRSE